MTFLEWVELIESVIVAVAAITAALVAIEGVGQWKEQLHGKSQYALALSLQVKLLRYRDAIKGVRNPFVSAAEMYPEDEDADPTRARDQFKGIMTAYQNRWKSVNDARAELYPDLVEAEVFWSEKIRELFDPIFSEERALFRHIKYHLEIQNPDKTDKDKEYYLKKTEEINAYLYDIGDDDNYNKNQEALITAVKDFFKPVLENRAPKWKWPWS